MTADSGDGTAGGAPVDDSSDRAAGGPRCPHCESPMYKRHCKYVCPHHGVIIDCSDPFR
ncbi:HVO_2523 family zinc finger protein [Haloarchaeobius amylolyticus]|uniref:HVO_2523 family zinc finger protein n=1 Tax=Haloarchaeobius amylolyticus TaxID=1198296 RepID=A0ABD6BD80_9EURY